MLITWHGEVAELGVCAMLSVAPSSASDVEHADEGLWATADNSPSYSGVFESPFAEIQPSRDPVQQFRFRFGDRLPVVLDACALLTCTPVTAGNETKHSLLTHTAKTFSVNKLQNR